MFWEMELHVALKLRHAYFDHLMAAGVMFILPVTQPLFCNMCHAFCPYLIVWNLLFSVLHTMIKLTPSVYFISCIGTRGFAIVSYIDIDQQLHYPTEPLIF